MKSDVIVISGGTDQTGAVLTQAERAAAYRKLSDKGALHLRLLAEEMMSMMRAVTGGVYGEFWIESEGEQFELHLHAVTAMDYEKRSQLLSASTSGRNEANRGLMGKIRAFFEPIEGVPMYLDLTPSGMGSEMVWSMCAYQQQLKQNVRQNVEGSAEAWDELEKSVIAHVADEVKISIRGCDVDMIVYKKLS